MPEIQQPTETLWLVPRSSFQSTLSLINCILWDGGNEIDNADGSAITVTYSDVQGGTGEPWFGTGCIDLDPLFVVGPWHAYYLSQSAAGQGTNSPCVDTGSDTAANLGLDALTTRTDHVGDAGTVDMGYHSAIPPIPGDVDGNGVVDGLDLTAVITAWETIPGDPLWNTSADLDCNGIVDGLDLTEVISNWTTAAAAESAAAPAVAPEPAATETVQSVAAPVNPGRCGSGGGNIETGKGNVRRE